MAQEQTIKKIIDELNRFQEKKHFSFDPEEENVERAPDDKEKRQRIIKDLNRFEPHSLAENFTYKVPYGFILENEPVKGLKTWKSLYLNFLSMLSKKDPEQFMLLPEEDLFVSPRGNHMFARTEKDVRSAEKLPEGFFAEVNLSSMYICKTIIKLLSHFKFTQKDMKIYLQEDRDA